MHKLRRHGNSDIYDIIDAVQNESSCGKTDIGLHIFIVQISDMQLKNSKYIVWIYEEMIMDIICVSSWGGGGYGKLLIHYKYKCIQA